MPIFFNFSRSSLQQIGNALRLEEFKHKEIIFNKGENFDDDKAKIYFIKSGNV
jgi:hypothetical protein